jgi:outer membrane protein OmpA-like peptidoglycan-associated protein
MRWTKRALWLAYALVLATPASAQVVGHPIELSGGAGYFAFDSRARIKDAPAYTGGLAIRVAPWLSFEAAAALSFSESELDESQSHDFAYYGADLRWNLVGGENKVVPFVITGFGYGSSKSDAADPTELNGGAATLGLGVLYNVLNPRTYVRLQVRDVFFNERYFEQMNQHFAVTLGLQYTFGGKYKDIDLDGVRDWLDHCPLTPIGAQVTPDGCPTDADQDSVFDGLDSCASTPRGCVVDRNGCPVDSDGDGVCDGLDRCADTPRGAKVDAQGCTSDSDGDRVPDGIDQCEGTAAGCVVDSTTGCPTDSDGDGVCDGLDQCPKTERGMPVDSMGCVLRSGLLEAELFDTGEIVLQDINFPTASAEIPEDGKQVLNSVGQVLVKYPAFKIEVGGHTDNVGAASANKKLSEKRAKSVREYVLSAFPGLAPGQFVAKGYGPSAPIAPNTSEVGRQKNRRVHFRVLNRDELRKEMEKRRQPKSP